MNKIITRFAGAVALATLCSNVHAQSVPASAFGFDGKTISVGYIGPLSGPVAVLGQPVLVGIKLWMEKVNAEGGIAGRYPIQLLTEDHQNAEAMTVQRYARLKGDVAAMAIFGTHTTKAVLPELRRDKVVVSPSGFEGFMINDPNLLPIGSTYELMSINAVDYLLEKDNKKDSKFCGLIRDDPYGLAGLKGWEFALAQHGKKVAQTSYFAAPDKDFTGQVNQLKSAGCEVVLVTTVPGQLVSIASSAVRARYEPVWVGQWPSWHGALLGTPVIDYLEKNLLVAGEGVEWGSQDVVGMQNMLEDLKRYMPGQKPDLWIVVGYNQGRALTGLLEQAVADGDMSREGIMQAMTRMPAVDNQGMGGNYKYGPIAKRQPALAGTVFRVNREKPFGLEQLEVNYVSPLASKFVFEDGVAVPSQSK